MNSLTSVSVRLSPSLPPIRKLDGSKSHPPGRSGECILCQDVSYRLVGNLCPNCRKVYHVRPKNRHVH